MADVYVLFKEGKCVTLRTEDMTLDKVSPIFKERCCGSKDSSDWLKNLYVQSSADLDLLPCSCFNVSRLPTETWCSRETNITVHQGCKEKVDAWLEENIQTIVAMAFSLILSQVVLFGLIASLYHAISRKAMLKKRPPVDADHAPLDYEDLTNGEQNFGYIDDDGYRDPAYIEDLHGDAELVEDPRFYTNNRF